jgi:acyl-CoA synthetase (NDP forming)
VGPLQVDIANDPRVKPIGGGVAFTSSSADSVKAFLPITVQERLDTGESVTLLNAQNHGGDGYFGAPLYKAHYAVVRRPP